MKLTASIIDYLGKYENGILTLINLNYNNQSFDGTFYYTNSRLLITVDDSLLETIGCQIEQHPEYYELLLELIRSAEPYEEIIDQLDEISS